MRSLSAYLENQIAQRLSSHSALFWLSFYREIMRINPVESFSEPADYTRQTRYTELCIIKYASTESGDVEISDSLWQIRPSAEDMLALLEVCGMAGLASAARVDCRRLAMGARLITVSGDWETVFNESLNSLVEVYIRRRQGYTNIFHHAGVSGPSSLTEGRGAHWIAIAGKTVGDITWSGLSKSYATRPPLQADDAIDENGEYRPNFGLREHSLDDAVHWLELVGAEFELSEGFSFLEALAIIRAISSIGLEREATLRLGHCIRSTGLAIIKAEEIVIRATRDLGASAPPSSSLLKALSFFTRPANSREGIVPGNVFDLRHIIRLETGELVVDYVTIFSSVWQLFNFLGNVEQLPAKRRSTAFEKVVSQQVSEAVPLAKPWALNQPVRFSDGTKREIDVAFVVNDTLFVCECKSMARRPKDDVPAPARLEGRWRSLQSALRQVDDLAELLAAQELVRPRPIPTAVETIVSCVVTPSAEWIPSQDQMFWFTHDVPRFCTIGEVIRVARMVGSGSAVPNRISRPRNSP